MKRLVWYTLVVLFTLGILALLWQFHLALLLFLLSLAIAATVRPVVDRLIKRGLPRGLAIALTYLVGFLIIGVPVVLAGNQIGNELQNITDNFAASYTWFRNTADTGTQFQKLIATRLPPLDALYQGITGERSALLAQNILGFASGFFGTISNLVIIIVMSIYWSIDQIHFERLWLSLLPGGKRTRARQIWREIESGMGAYIRSELVQSLLAAILLSVVYRALGLEYPILLALVGALAWLIPWLGAVLALVPAFLAGYAGGLWLGIAAAGVTAFVLGVMELVIEPRLFNRRRYSSLLIVLMVIAMADAFGLVGLLFAPPLAAAIQILSGRLLSQPSLEPLADPSIQLANLKTRLGQVQEMAAGIEGPSPLIASLIGRLEELVQDAEQAIDAGPAEKARV